ncbi:hypothetical protein SKTS_25540 [Sulfurimicrobium lacus]|uniref:Cytochrome c domain-containing protein n=1 Tax=Sulfurimicrobium lacus TaxID=2715678 RepID=A0A6F8VD68_9PROT|nr:cytochrome c [Sulfurimicrobium lacus]BCB27668.1 hypothetical protein SKTS_25540 [Sulfurimicrobium lacus]
MSNHKQAWLTIALGLAACGASAAAESGAPSAERQRELVSLVRKDCGSCHGMTLSGGLGLALLPATLKDKPTENLVATVLYGRPGTPMPPWRAFLSDEDAEWVVEMLKKGFPDER